MRLIHHASIVLALSPVPLQAQVLAGDTTGLAYTSVSTLIASPYGSGFNGEQANLYLGVSGTMDLFLFAGNAHSAMGDQSWTQVNPTPSGLEIASIQPGQFLASRLDSLAPVNASLSWVGYAELIGDQLVLASMARDTNDPNNWIGTGHWFEGEGDTTQGYLAVRFPQQTDTLYGWLRLTSYVTRDSSWLRIHDFAIETSSVNSTNDQFSPPPITAFFDANGSLQILGGESGKSVQVSVRDMAGRLLASEGAMCPSALEISRSAQGLYVVTLTQDQVIRTLRLAR